MTSQVALLVLLVAGLGTPAILGLSLLVSHPRAARLGVAFATWQSIMMFAAYVALLLAFVQSGTSNLEFKSPSILRLETWSWTPVWLVDQLALVYSGLVTCIYAVIVRFSRAAMVREPGSARFWFLVSLFAGALQIAAFSGNIDVLYVGWELVGLTSVLLIAFFRTSVRSNSNSLRALVYYRVGDLFLLAATIAMHHDFVDARFVSLAKDAQDPDGPLVAFLLLFATLAKSAQLPMSPWLHRAMEGPAASSGIFYGALSVHLGPFLLLRMSPLWLSYPSMHIVMCAIGVTTAIYATFVGRTRPDAKTALAYATMAQLGVIFVEISLGLLTLATAHMVAHAGLRTWQFLRSSSLIQDFQDNPQFRTGVELRRASQPEQYLPVRINEFLYIAALRQFWLDAVQWQFIAKPILWFFNSLAQFEDRLLKRRNT